MNKQGLVQDYGSGYEDGFVRVDEGVEGGGGEEIENHPRMKTTNKRISAHIVRLFVNIRGRFVSGGDSIRAREASRSGGVLQVRAGDGG